MDDIDRNLIEALQEDGRLAQARLAERVGLSVSAVNERIRRLEAQGVIAGIEARIAPRAVGVGLLAFVYVLLERPEHDAGFVAGIRALAEVQECHHVTGAWSYLLKIRACDTADLERVLVGGIKALAGVVRSETVIALSTAKETARIKVPR